MSANPQKATVFNETNELNILLIEDDYADAEMVTRYIAKCSAQGKFQVPAQVTHVNYLQKGMDVINSGSVFDVAILDLHLPDGAGRDAVTRLIKAAPETPVVVLTGQDVDETIEAELFRSGAQDYVAKSEVDANSLCSSIRHAIERHQLLSEIKRQAIELKQNNEELESFAYIASHDLRSPLVNIMGFSEELRRSIRELTPIVHELMSHLSERNRLVLQQEIEVLMPEALEFIQISTRKMDALVSSILRLSRLGRREFQLENIDVVELVTECIKNLEHRAQQSDASFRIGALPSIVADRVSLEQIFSNILDNALKYGAPGRKNEIVVSGMRLRDHTRYSVRDTGRGIARDDQSRVFEVFRRASNVGEVPGDGIGMTYVKALVRRHRGNIWFESELNRGTTFMFTIANGLDGAI